MQSIIEQIIKLRTKGLNCPDEGMVICQVRELTLAEKAIRVNPIKLINTFFSSDLSFEYSVLENKNIWKEIDKTTAKLIIKLALTDNYGLIEERIPETVAEKLSDSFMNIFSNPRYFTNGEYHFEKDGHWEKFVSVYGLIEEGVICFDEKLIGILWVVDDD